MNATIIILLRDPVDRVLSDYQHYKETKNLPNVTIEDLIFDGAGQIRLDSEIIFPSKQLKAIKKRSKMRLEQLLDYFQASMSSTSEFG